MNKILISHRGNLLGKKPELENTPVYIDAALAQGFKCEVDVYSYDDKLYLGHDHAQIETSVDYLQQDGIIAHAKNLNALSAMLQVNIHCFYHHNDDYTLTSRNWIWAFPGKPGTLEHPCIAVLPENYTTDVTNFDGVCSDFIAQFK
jgi:hypothetical protein|tara:strand:+ start:242 stop:679 length:438 start_codon:yes stop_codon:yes gene_type:complete